MRLEDLLKDASPATLEYITGVSTGFFPSSTPAAKPAEKPCDTCKQLLTGMDRISHTAFHWQALEIAQEYLKPPKESK